MQPRAGMLRFVMHEEKLPAIRIGQTENNTPLITAPPRFRNYRWTIMIDQRAMVPFLNLDQRAAATAAGPGGAGVAVIADGDRRPGKLIERQ